MKAGAGDRQGQEAEQALLQRVDGPGDVEGDGDHEQTDREVHQGGMDRQGVGQIVGAQLAGQLVDGLLRRQVEGHREQPRMGKERIPHTSPARVASTTFTVCRP